MRVRVSYTVEFDSIPSEVANIVEGTAGKLSELSVNLSQTSTDLIREPLEKALLSIKNLDSARQQLASLDMRLADCYDILSGFVDHKNRGFPANEPELEQEEEDPADSAT